MSSLQKIRDKGRTGCARKRGGREKEGRGEEQGGEMTQIMYAHVNK
jgi:hypothetical protein